MHTLLSFESILFRVTNNEATCNNCLKVSGRRAFHISPHLTGHRMCATDRFVFIPWPQLPPDYIGISSRACTNTPRIYNVILFFYRKKIVDIINRNFMKVYENIPIYDTSILLYNSKDCFFCRFKSLIFPVILFTKYRLRHGMLYWNSLLANRGSLLWVHVSFCSSNIHVYYHSRTAGASSFHSSLLTPVYC